MLQQLQCLENYQPYCATVRKISKENDPPQGMVTIHEVYTKVINQYTQLTGVLLNLTMQCA